MISPDFQTAANFNVGSAGGSAPDPTAVSAEHVQKLVGANEELIGEVLRGYERSNLILEFTSRIADVANADQFIDELLMRAAQAVKVPFVCLHCANGSRRFFDVRSGRSDELPGVMGLENSLQDSVELARRQRRAFIRTLGEFHVILAALARLGDRVDVVLVVRAAPSPPFQSDDLLTIESLLTFGGQIIRNYELNEQLRAMSVGVMRALVAAIDKKDHYTSGHSERVGALARMTGERLGVNGRPLQLLEWSGLLHDVGKIGVPEQILCKPGNLSPEELAIIRKHPEMGYDILKPIGSLSELLDGVRYHHENVDGSGYPDKLRGNDIPQSAQIIHVVDVFDALCTSRSYRAAFSIEKAVRIMQQEAGTSFEPETLAAFLDVLQQVKTESPGTLTTMYAPADAPSRGFIPDHAQDSRDFVR